jgi:nucleoid-associated protein YgaU/DNA-binding SARP family transcriptional activator
VARAAHENTYTVQDTRPAESLWSIAESRMGDGNRWHEIAALNEGRVMTDGTVFHAQGFLQPGWKLLMPEGTSTATVQETATVRPGDSLGSIADRELGDPARYPEIFDLNRGTPQPGGGTFTDPNLIFPGQKLQLPEAGADAADDGNTPEPGEKRPSEPAESAKPGDTGDADDSGETGGAGGGAERGEVGGPTETAKPDETATPETPAKPTETAKPDESGKGEAPAPALPDETAKPDDAASVGKEQPSASAENETPGESDTVGTAEDGEDGAIRTVAGFGALLAAGVLGVLGARRIVQHRRRRPRRRISLPEGEAAALEREMRAASADVPEGLDLLDRALRTLAASLGEDESALPPITAAVITPEGTALHLSEPAPARRPFTPVISGDDIWWCPKDTDSLLSAQEASCTALPYPALISLGTSSDGHPVLVDLEHIGMLRLDGDEDDIRAVLLALAVELASDSLHAEHTIRLVGFGQELKAAFPGRVVHHATLASAVAGLRGHDAAQRRALAESGAESLREARLLGTGADAWAPQIVLCSLPLTEADESALDLVDLIGAQPRTSLAAVTSAGDALALPGTWNMAAAPDVVIRLPGAELEVALQRLEPAQYESLLELMDITGRSGDEPTPAWARPEDPRVTLTVAAVPDPDPADEHEEGTGLPVAEMIAAPLPAPAAPYVRVLGRVELVSAEGPVEPNRRGRLTEMAAWLVLHPGLEHHALDEAIWPGRQVGHSLRNSNMSKLRAWVGGQEYLPFVSDGRYMFASSVRCDWSDFQEFYRDGMHAKGEAADAALANALALVQGSPFAATNPRNYLWADAMFHDMLSAIVDVAHELASRCLAAGDHSGAVAAATRGMAASPESELLVRDLFRAHAAVGDRTAILEAADRLNRLNEELGTDAEDETIDLLRELLTAIPDMDSSSAA